MDGLTQMQCEAKAMTPSIENELQRRLEDAEQNVSDIKKLQALLQQTPAIKDVLNLMGRLGVRRF